jgi:hypothetical protein
MTDTIRVQGQTAYIAEKGSRSPSVITNALALSAAAVSGSSALIVPDKVANFVAQLGILSGSKLLVCG